MKDHVFKNYIVSRNNYFKHPDKVVEISSRQQYERSTLYPGLRTQNLLESTDLETQQFAVNFANNIKVDIFPGISKFLIDIRFHINDQYNNEEVNSGWIHNDDCDLAGLIYLTKGEINFLNGTSIFNKVGAEDFVSDDFISRQDFNLKNQINEQYIKDLKNNWSQFDESIRIGNQYNRIVAYDAKLFHRPNSYLTTSGNKRLSLVFFIKGFTPPEYKRIDI
jgi:hypothetical protein